MLLLLLIHVLMDFAQRCFDTLLMLSLMLICCCRHAADADIADISRFRYGGCHATLPLRCRLYLRHAAMLIAAVCFTLIRHFSIARHFAAIRCRHFPAP